MLLKKSYPRPPAPMRRGSLPGHRCIAMLGIVGSRWWLSAVLFRYDSGSDAAGVCWSFCALVMGLLPDAYAYPAAI